MEQIFCAKCQTVTEHKVSVDGNGEFLFECQTADCGRFIKLPADFPGETIEDYMTAHQEANTGQVSIEDQEKKLAEMLTNLKQS